MEIRQENGLFSNDFIEKQNLNLGQLCTLQFLPALQIITMPESTQPGDLVANLQIIGNTSTISTRLVYNSSDVRTNGTDYFILNFTNLYLRSCKFSSNS